MQITSLGERHSGGVRGRGRGSFRGRGRWRGRFGLDKTQIEYYKCHKFGHFRFDCPNSEKQVNYVEIQGAKMEDLWFLDSGCSNHMSGIKKWFSDLDETFRHSVKLGNNARMMVHGKGNIKLKITEDYDLIFTGNCEKMFLSFKESMKRNFDMTDLGKIRYFLGVEVLQREEAIYMCQQKFTRDILNKFGMENNNEVSNPIIPGVKLSKKEGEAEVDITLISK
uniref:Uncharacterized protein LOC105851731 n=1 Tax=Cicer arietinum TaxID=3827 RepID=A0A1S3DZC2_CICAR|nr:uncharacterized protein LOC105851731 [Cicer arietinum]